MTDRAVMLGEEAFPGVPRSGKHKDLPSLVPSTAGLLVSLPSCPNWGLKGACRELPGDGADDQQPSLLSALYATSSQIPPQVLRKPQFLL